MRKINYLFLATICFGLLGSMTSCSNDDENASSGSTDLSGTYSGYLTASCAYFQNDIEPEQTLTIATSIDGKASVDAASTSYGHYVVSDVVVSHNSNGTDSIHGSGSVSMGMGESSSDYAFEMYGEVKASESKAVVKFVIPAVMRGLSVTFVCDGSDVPGSYYVTGSYEGYSLASFAYATNMITTDAAPSLTTNADGTVNLTYTDATWGNFSFSNMTVTKTDGNYVFEGTDSVSMGMDTVLSKYKSTVKGVITSDKKVQSLVFGVPDVMGGVTIVFHEGDMPAAVTLASYSSLTGVFKDGADVVASGQKFTLSLEGPDSNEGYTLKITTSSSTYTSFSISGVSVQKQDDAFSVTGGTGTVTIGGATYAMTVAGTVGAGGTTGQLTFNVEGYEGGKTLTLTIGE